MNNYKVLFSANAETDLDNIHFYYKNINPKIAFNFLDSLQNELNTIAIFPFGFPVKHHIFRAELVKGFPYSILYDIDENQNIIYINRIFHNKQNSTKK